MSSRSAINYSTRTIKIYASAFDAQARADIDAHVADTNNPHQVDKADVGLGAVDNTPDLSKPISTLQAEVFALKAPLDSPALTGLPTGPTAPLGTISTQLATAEFVQAAINASVGTDLSDELAEHLDDTANPHQVDATDVGLGEVNNTADVDKPISAATQIALNAANSNIATVAGDLDLHEVDHNNPHAVDAADVGLDLVDNTADAGKPVSGPQQAAINVAAAIGTAAQADIDGHQANVSNPHAVTKAQIGLGNVANIAPADLPINDATQIALNLKAPLLSPALTGLPTAPTAPPLTNSTQLATTAYADAAVATAFEALDDPTDAALDAINADIQYRPGDAVALYGETKFGPQSAVVLIDPAWVATSPAGAVVRITGTTASDPQIVAPAAVLPVEPGRIYSIRWRVQRITDPLDPLNDSVTLGLSWMTSAKGGNGQAIVENIPLTVAHGVQERIRRISLAAGQDFTAPAGTVYVRPYVEAFGLAAAVTDVIDIDVDDITEAVANSIHVPGYVPAPPASGSTVTLTSLAPAFIDNPAALAALTIRLPPVTTAGFMEIGFNRPVTALTVQDSAGAPVPDSAVNAYGPGAAQYYRFLNPTRRWVYWK